MKKKIICPFCGKDDKVVLVNYGKKDKNGKIKDVEWSGFECERCFSVVKEIELKKELVDERRSK